ncbi:MAG: helix-turn-helix domain-containing protein [Anaerolineae bacterium]
MSAIETLAIQPNVYYTPEEAAQLLRVSEQDVIDMLQSGRAHGVQIGPHWRVLGRILLDLSREKQEQVLTETDYAPLDELIGLCETGDATAALEHDTRIYRR